MITVLHMNTDEVRYWISSTIQRLDFVTQQLEICAHSVTGMDWSGSARDQFTGEYLEVSSRLRVALEQGISLAQRVEQEVVEWEEMAVHLGLGGVTASPSVDGGWLDFPDWTISGLTAVDWVNKVNQWAISPALLIASVRQGVNYADEIRVFGSLAWKQWMLGLPVRYTTSHSGTLLKTLGKQTASTYVFEGVQLAADFVQDYDEYKGDWGMVGSAWAYDVAKAGAGILASKAGMSIGATLGTALIPIPGVGTVVGGVIGSAVGSLVADAVLDDSLWELFGKDNPVDDCAVQAIHGLGQWIADAI